MSEKRFIVESVMIDCLCEDEPRIAKVITDTDENYSYEDLYEVAELLNEQQSTISNLKEENDILKQKLRKNYIVNKQYEEMKRLQEENEQLKEEIEPLKQKEEVLNKIWRTYLENHE